MSHRVIVFSRKAVFVFLMWSVTLPILYLSCRDFEPQHLSGGNIASPLKNTVGPFSISHYYGGQPQCDFALAFDRLSVSKGSAGLFKTALFQRADVTGLRLQSFIYSTAPAERKFPYVGRRRKKLPRLAMPFDPLTNSRFFEKAIQQVMTQSDLKTSLPDLSRAVEVSVCDFQWQHFLDRQLELSVTSGLAVHDLQSPDELILKGHVILETPLQTLETNQAVFNTKTGQFKIKDAYVLTIDDQKTFGRDICVDSRLMRISPPRAAL